MKQKKVPMRRCIGCYESKPKKELIRIVKQSDGNIVLDCTGKLNGRGAYLCNDIKCLEKVIKGKKLNKEFETEISKETYENIKSQFEMRDDMFSDKSGGGAVG